MEHYRYKIHSIAYQKVIMDKVDVSFYKVRYKPKLLLTYSDFEQEELNTYDDTEVAIIVKKDVTRWLYNNASSAYQKTVDWQSFLEENTQVILSKYINDDDFKKRRTDKQYHFNRIKNG